MVKETLAPVSALQIDNLAIVRYIEAVKGLEERALLTLGMNYGLGNGIGRCFGGYRNAEGG